MSSPVMSTTQDGAQTAPLPRIADRRSATHGARLLAVVSIAPLVAYFWANPESRGSVLLIGAILFWALDVLPDYVVALGVIVVWNIAAIGPSAASLSGFASPVWFLLLGVLAVGGGLARSGVLQRIAFALLTLFPATFRGQAVAFLVGGLVMTPFLLNSQPVARCALTAPLARQVAEALGYPARSRAAVGIGLAAFAGSGLLSRVFLSGATLNLIAWSLLPPAARPGWWMWAMASAPMLLVLAVGVLTVILLTVPPGERSSHRTRRDPATTARFRTLDSERAGGRRRRPRRAHRARRWSIREDRWRLVRRPGPTALTATGVLTREQFRSAIDWPLLIFLGVILGMPAMIHHTGVDAQLATALPPLVVWAQGAPAWTLTLLFLVVTAARVVLSEWVRLSC